MAFRSRPGGIDFSPWCALALALCHAYRGGEEHGLGRNDAEGAVVVGKDDDDDVHLDGDVDEGGPQPARRRQPPGDVVRDRARGHLERRGADRDNDRAAHDPPERERKPRDEHGHGRVVRRQDARCRPDGDGPGEGCPHPRKAAAGQARGQDRQGQRPRR
jgi:hypothetical protein